MKKISLLLFSLQFIALLGISQQLSPSSLDSLKSIWNVTENPDSLRFEALNEFIEKGYLRYDNDSAQYFSEIHLDLAVQKSNDLQRAKALNLKGLSYAMRGNMDSCLVYFKKSFLVHQRIQNSYGEGRSAYNLGNVFSTTGPLDSAVFYYDHSSKIYELLKDTAGMAKGLFASSKVARRIGNFEFALKQMTKSIELEKEVVSPSDLSLSYGDLGAILKKLSRYKEAAEAFKTSYEYALKSGLSSEIVGALNKLIKLKLEDKEPQLALTLIAEAQEATNENTEPYVSIVTKLYEGHALKDLKNSDSAILIYEEVISMAETHQEIGLKSSALSSLAQNAEDSNNYIKALEYYKLLEENDKKLDYDNPDVYMLFGLSACYRNLGDINKAIQYAEEGVLVSERMKDNGGAIESYKNLYLANADAGDYKNAFTSFQKWNELRELNSSEENQKATVKLAYDYEYEKKTLTDSLNFATQKVILENESKTQKQRTSILLIVLAVISIFSFFLFKLYRENKSKNRIISKALKEKDTLLREIHHRVKNNLQVVSSLLRLQSNSTTDESAQEALKEGQARVRSMSLIHQNLYGKDNLTGITMKSYLEELSKELIQSYSTDTDVNLTTNIDDFKLDVDTVIPLGLIINELVTNSIKYAFPNRSEGKIEIDLNQKDSLLILTVKDNGVGMPDDFDPELSDSFGFSLIQAFMSKLDATMKLSSDDGTSVQIEIKEFGLTE